MKSIVRKKEKLCSKKEKKGKTLFKERKGETLALFLSVAITVLRLIGLFVGGRN